MTREHLKRSKIEPVQSVRTYQNRNFSFVFESDYKKWYGKDRLRNGKEVKNELILVQVKHSKGRAANL